MDQIIEIIQSQSEIVSLKIAFKKQAFEKQNFLKINVQLQTLPVL